MNSRIRSILAKLKQQNLEGLIISCPANISYLTKSLSRDAYFLVSTKGNFYFTDSRYIEEAKNKLKGRAHLKKIDGSAFKLIADTCLDLGIRNIGFEERNLAYAEYKKIKESLKGKVYLIPTHSLIEDARQIKEPQEVENIKKALKITISALKFIKGFIAQGKREIEVVAELEHFIRYQGASGSAFNIIVASGPNSSFPHHTPTQKRLGSKTPVLIDLGVDYLGYKSDLTRVFFLDKMSVLERKIYDIVLEAQGRAIKKIRPGERISEVDKAARQYIAQKGYAKYFGHNLGHGIGLEVHEEPHISARVDNFLKPGMVFTVEPAVYLPGRFGIRIEDAVLVTGKGCEVLSGTLNK
jgi:Xaa-Pro aminopeptidase